MRRHIATLAAAAVLSLGATHAFAADPGPGKGDAAKGKRQFNQCKACHSEKAGQVKVGPSLFGVYGRTAGTEEHFAKRYSKAMKEAGEKGLKWDEAHLFAYLDNPHKFLQDYLKTKSVHNKMPTSFRNPAMRRNVIAYLKTLK
jgi:cytochrome c